MSILQRIKGTFRAITVDRALVNELDELNELMIQEGLADDVVRPPYAVIATARDAILTVIAERDSAVQHIQDMGC